MIASGLHSSKESYVVVVVAVVVKCLLLRMVLSEGTQAAAVPRYGVVACFAFDLQAKYFSLYFCKYSWHEGNVSNGSCAVVYCMLCIELLCTVCCVLSCLLVVGGLNFNMDLGRSDPV
jgi:hypothetical protein